MKKNTYNNYYTSILYLVIILLILYGYQIYKYGLRGYLDQRLARKQQRYDALYDIIQGNI